MNTETGSAGPFIAVFDNLPASEVCHPSETRSYRNKRRAHERDADENAYINDPTELLLSRHTPPRRHLFLIAMLSLVQLASLFSILFFLSSASGAPGRGHGGGHGGGDGGGHGGGHGEWSCFAFMLCGSGILMTENRWLSTRSLARTQPSRWRASRTTTF